MSILDSVTSSIFSKAGSISEDLFGYQGATLVGYLDSVFADGKAHTEVIKYFYQQLYRDFAPDINGYTLIFFVPPHLSGYNNDDKNSTLYGQDNKDSYMNVVGKLMTFAAVDFSPPQSQVRTENITTRSGAIPIASEVSESDTCSITFVDNQFLDIYMFHHIWVEYIREILEGTVEPSADYYTPPDDNGSKDDPMWGPTSSVWGVSGENYGVIDYAASFYIVKYRPDMKTITFAAKCVGIFPQSLPNKELIGSRTSNEIVTLPFTYSCSGYREAIYMETDNWIFAELEDIFTKYKSASASPLFGGFLGGVLNKVIGPTNGILSNLTGNAAKLGGITGSVQNSTSSMWSSIKGVSNGNFSSIFKVN